MLTLKIDLLCYSIIYYIKVQTKSTSQYITYNHRSTAVLGMAITGQYLSYVHRQHVSAHILSHRQVVRGIRNIL
jgi:hypothetical protein